MKSFQTKVRATTAPKLPTTSKAGMPRQNAGVLVYGPAGCGKTTHAQALAKFYGKTRIVDDWEPGGRVPADTLALTNALHQGAVDFVDAASAAGVRLSPARKKAIAAARGVA
jgi:Holliday junction resolvasome RuvABC ATP-dependent DNA helicase subunit